MGRGMFGGGPGPWGEDPWKGWWGEEPPFHSPVFVLTHHAREPLELKGTTFHFVTDGIEAALERATAAAGGSDVAIGGGADVFQQYIAAGLVDEMWVNVVPVLLGGGTPLFDERTAGADLEQVRVVEGPGVAHLEYRRR
jgi:dihydrofolate reductase